MKAIFLSFIIIAVIALGCTTQKEDYIFSNGLTELQAIEDKYNLSANTTSVQNLENGKIELILLRHKFDDYNETRDITALKSLTEFRVFYIDVQKNAKIGSDMMLNVNVSCANNKTISEALVYIDDSVENSQITANKFLEFKTNFPEYLNRTRINNNFDIYIIQIASNLNNSSTQIKMQLESC
jgi:hypothetical protein